MPRPEDPQPEDGTRDAFIVAERAVAAMMLSGLSPVEIGGLFENMTRREAMVLAGSLRIKAEAAASRRDRQADTFTLRLAGRKRPPAARMGALRSVGCFVPAEAADAADGVLAAFPGGVTQA